MPIPGVSPGAQHRLSGGSYRALRVVPELSGAYPDSRTSVPILVSTFGWPNSRLRPSRSSYGPNTMVLGLLPAGNVAVTVSVAMSITETVPSPELVT